VTTRKPADGREVAAHVALALSRYVRESRVDAVWVPDEVERLAVLLADVASRRQGETSMDPAADAGHGRLMDTASTLLLNRRELAHALRCSVRTVDRLIGSGALVAVKIEGSTRVRRSDLDEYVSRLAPRRSFHDRVATKGQSA